MSDDRQVLSWAEGGDDQVGEQIINCRARVLGDCLHGHPASDMVPVAEGPLEADGTWDGATGTVVCDVCYAALMPLTLSGKGLNHELGAAIGLARALRGKARRTVHVRNDSADGTRVAVAQAAMRVWFDAGYDVAPVPADGKDHLIGQACPACSGGAV